MCRNKNHGGRRCPSVGSDRERKLNTARRRVSRAKKAVEAYRDENPQANTESDQEYSRLLAKLHTAQEMLDETRAETSKEEFINTPLPSRLLCTGADLHSRYPAGISTRLSSDYDPSLVSPVRNRESVEDSAPGKPVGGLWVAPVDEHTGLTGWEELMGNKCWKDNGDGTESLVVNMKSSRNSVEFKPDAKVLVIDSWKDYTDAVNAAPRHVPDRLSRLIGVEPDDRKGLDYEALGVDAVFVTEKGISECSNADKTFSHRLSQPDGKDYESLNGWDFASGIIINPDAARVEASSYSPEGFEGATRPKSEDSDDDYGWGWDDYEEASDLLDSDSPEFNAYASQNAELEAEKDRLTAQLRELLGTEQN